MEQGTQKVREPKKEMAWSFFRWGTLPCECMREKQEVCILIYEVAEIVLRTRWMSPAVCGRNWTWVLVNKRRERGREMSAMDVGAQSQVKRGELKRKEVSRREEGEQDEPKAKTHQWKNLSQLTSWHNCSQIVSVFFSLQALIRSGICFRSLSLAQVFSPLSCPWDYPKSSGLTVSLDICFF